RPRPGCGCRPRPSARTAASPSPTAGPGNARSSVRRYAAEGALVLAALCFGATFPLVHDALRDIEPFAYLVLRFAIAVVALAPFAVVIGRRRGEDRRVLLRVGLLAGTLLAGGYAAQTVGLQ